jgi:hypothetical protein
VLIASQGLRALATRGDPACATQARVHHMRHRKPGDNRQPDNHETCQAQDMLPRHKARPQESPLSHHAYSGLSYFDNRVNTLAKWSQRRQSRGRLLTATRDLNQRCESGRRLQTLPARRSGTGPRPARRAGTEAKVEKEAAALETARLAWGRGMEGGAATALYGLDYCDKVRVGTDPFQPRSCPGRGRREASRGRCPGDARRRPQGWQMDGFASESAAEVSAGRREAS